MILQRELKLYQFMLDYCRLLTDDITEEQLTLQPAAGAHHPAWILGHLAIACDYAALCLGGSWACPREWHELFGPGSQVQSDRSVYPSKAELLTAIEAGHARVAQAAENATEAQLSQPREGFLADKLPLVGDMLAHLMTTHAAIHLGQLSMWRRIHGLPSVLGV